MPIHRSSWYIISSSDSEVVIVTLDIHTQIFSIVVFIREDFNQAFNFQIKICLIKNL